MVPGAQAVRRNFSPEHCANFPSAQATSLLLQGELALRNLNFSLQWWIRNKVHRRATHFRAIASWPFARRISFRLWCMPRFLADESKAKIKIINPLRVCIMKRADISNTRWKKDYIDTRSAGMGEKLKGHRQWWNEKENKTWPCVKAFYLHHLRSAMNTFFQQRTGHWNPDGGWIIVISESDSEW